MEHEAQPHQGNQHQLIEKEIGDHGKTPFYRWSNKGILPGFAGYRISRKIEVQDLVARQPAIEGTIPDAFERMQESQGDHRTGPEVRRGVFGDGA